MGLTEEQKLHLPLGLLLVEPELLLDLFILLRLRIVWLLSETHDSRCHVVSSSD
jgi:hypothetical protein